MRRLLLLIVLLPSCPLAASAQELGPGADRFEASAPADLEVSRGLVTTGLAVQEEEINVRRDMLVAFGILAGLVAVALYIAFFEWASPAAPMPELPADESPRLETGRSDPLPLLEPSGP